MPVGNLIWSLLKTTSAVWDCPDQANACESVLNAPKATAKHNKTARQITGIRVTNFNVEDFIAFPPSSCEVYTTAKRKYTLILVRNTLAAGSPCGRKD